MLLQTFALACAQVLATSLDGYFQLSIMLMILVIGLFVLAHVSPFRESVSQHVQVSNRTALPKVQHFPDFAHIFGGGAGVSGVDLRGVIRT